MSNDPGMAPRTVTGNDVWALRPPGSVAVTVNLADPAATGTTVTRLPDAVAVATSGLSEDAVNVRSSPSGSRKWVDASTEWGSSPTRIRKNGTERSGTGARLETVAKRTSGSATSNSIPLTPLGRSGVGPATTWAPDWLPLGRVTVTSSLSSLPASSTTAFAEMSPPWTVRPMVRLRGAPCASPTPTVAGPGARRSLVSVRRGSRVSGNGDPGFPSSPSLFSLWRPRNAPAWSSFN